MTHYEHKPKHNKPNTTIMELNDYCIYEILKQIKSECDSSETTDRLDQLKYKDIINFALARERFRDLFQIWNPELYRSLEIDQTYLSESSEIIVDFVKLHERLSKSTKKDKKAFWKIYTDALISKRMLQILKLSYMNPDAYCSEHKEVFDQFIGALKSRSLKSLIIDMEGYSVSSFQEFPNLLELELNVKFNADELVEYCKSNPNLTHLKILSNEIYGKLTDIVPYCNKLEFLSFKLKSYFNDSEYAGFAKLPNLRALIIVEEHENDSIETELIDDPPPFDFPLDYQLPQIKELATRKREDGSLTKFFRALALKEDTLLRLLDTGGYELYFEDISEIAKIKSLTRFACEFADLINVDSLKQHKHLTWLRDDISLTILNLFIARNMKSRIHFLNNGIMIKSGARKIIMKMDEKKCPGDLTPLANVSNLFYLNITRNRQDFSLSLMEAFASKQSSILQKLYLHSASYNEVEQIAKMKSLRYLNMRLSDPQSIKLLEHLHNLDTLTIHFEHDQRDIAKCVLNVLMGGANEICVIQNGLQIKFNKSLAKLTILNPRSVSLSAQQYAALAEIPHLNTLHLRGRHQKGSFEYLFKALAAKKCSHLQEIVVDRSIDIGETKVVAKIVSLKKLQCGFLDENSVELLPQLTNLKELVILTHDESSLKQFLQILVSQESSNLQCLAIKEGALSSEETALVAEVKSLKKLECGFVDAQNVEKLAQLNQLEELVINRIEKKSMQLFQILTSSVPQTLQLLNIELTAISHNETLAVVGIKSLRSLHCAFADIDSIELLVELPELEKLSISFILPSDAEAESIKSLAMLKNLTHLEIRPVKYNSLKSLFKKISLRSSLILQNLVIQGFYVDEEDIQEIIKITSLRRLKCGFSQNKSYQYLRYLKNLEVLEVISSYDLLDISQSLLGIFQECRNLKAINFHRYNFPTFISLEFVDEALKIIKAVRNPEEQGPLKLRFPLFQGLSPEHADEVYLKLSDLYA